MKTSELIALLQKEDPNDACVVCINNHPVSCVGAMPSYWDGRLEYIERDEKYHPIKAGYKGGGNIFKIAIFYDELETALLDNPEVELELSGITYNGQVNARYMSKIEKWKKEGQKYQEWERKAKEARDRGEDDPVFDLRNWKQKLGDWLEKIGLIQK